MRTVIFIPPLKKVSGGLVALQELACLLARLGFDVAVASTAQPGAVLDGVDICVPRLSWNKPFLGPHDIWLVPEGWPNAIAPGAGAGAQTLVYVQNWLFMMTALPEGVRWSRLPVRYLAVSRPVRWFCEDALGLTVDAVLPPSIHPDFFVQDTRRDTRDKHVRIAYMPRKNRALADQIRAVALACLETGGYGARVEFVSIHDRPRGEVARMLASCHIFMSTGFPEGFGLPPAEAMACGCVPVGFGGLGGFEYMRNPETCALRGLYSPPFDLPPVEETAKLAAGNGFFVSDGDVLGAGRALAHAVRLAHAGGGPWEALVANCRATAKNYTVEAREKAVQRIWDGLT
jgi:glycosyltransferase involved in cell wall biosynthesis